MDNVLIASGPVIIENNKILLNKHGEKKFWKFPGGDVYEKSGSLENWAVRKADEEMGIEPAEFIREWGWFDIDNLPKDLAPNIKSILEEAKTS